MIIQISAVLASSMKAYPVAMQPEMRLQQVMALGMFLIIELGICYLLYNSSLISVLLL